MFLAKLTISHAEKQDVTPSRVLGKQILVLDFKELEPSVGEGPQR